jgi:hypothetical protein
MIRVFLQRGRDLLTNELFWFANYWDLTNNLDEHRRNQREFLDWCHENYGPAGYREDTADVRWLLELERGYIRLFRDEDVTLMTLRWV